MARLSKNKSKYSLKQARRPANSINPHKSFLIVTEGKTEAAYFKHFKNAAGPRIEVYDGKVSQLSLVQEAIGLRKEALNNKSYDNCIDETWAVFDRDIDARKTTDKQTFNAALDLAERENIHIAYSNDSFELWFLIHFQDVSGNMHRSIVEEKLKKHLPNYKHGNDIFDKINNHYPQALRRAEQMLSEVEGTPPVDANPCTTIHLLTEKLREH